MIFSLWTKLQFQVPEQPLFFTDNKGKISRYNLRKLSELPFHLNRSQRFEDLHNEVIFNVGFLNAKLSSSPLTAVIAGKLLLSICLTTYVVKYAGVLKWHTTAQQCHNCWINSHTDHSALYWFKNIQLDTYMMNTKLNLYNVMLNLEFLKVSILNIHSFLLNINDPFWCCCLAHFDILI